ncbi:MAG: type III ribulose-bisphosphate carboxylase [Candidatus Aenigmarchaeota archaeon]|nr:type III ribulose-bisphosphate carboxylase [Candidatus Aenigmarchaeota archaeon]
MTGYVDLSYRPRDDLICEFYVEPSSGHTLKDAAEAVAEESSTGTWTEVGTRKPIVERIHARTFEIKHNTIRVAYPRELFEAGNIPQLMSSVAGNIFGMKVIKRLRLVNMSFPRKIVRAYKGPELGLREIRKLTRISKRPIVGTIYKPKLGLNPREQADLAYMIYSAGLDYSKDDENLGSMVFNRFQDRAVRILDVVDRIRSEQGRRVIYAANITSPVDEMLKRAQFIKDHGGKCIMIDILTAGWSALEYITKQKMKLIVHGHRAMHAALTRNPRHGISMLVIAKLARLAGVSALHTGTVVGKMEGDKGDVLDIDRFLRGRWHGLKPVMPIASGGLHPGLAPSVIEILGKDLIMTFGGGLWGHPGGPEAGARAIRQAVDSSMKGIPVRTYASDHPELAQAIKEWGTGLQ